MRAEATKAIYATWRGLRRGTQPPERSAINPAAFGLNLRNVFLLESGEDGQFRFRIAGASLSMLFGKEMQGQDIRAIFTHAALGDVREILAAATQDLCPVVAGGTALLDRFGADCELLFLPLLYDGRTDRRLFGSLTYSVADRHRLGECSGIDILSFRTIGANDRSILSRNGGDMAEPTAAGARRAHLTVYEGGLAT